MKKTTPSTSPSLKRKTEPKSDSSEKKRGLKKEPKKPTTPHRDYDSPWKEIMRLYFPQFLKLAMPDLEAQVDWTYPLEFLEQELINLLKGRLKIKDKIRNTDKLVKLRLLSGKDQYIFFHLENQHIPQSFFGRRMYVYRSLIALKHNTDDIVAIAVFTGEPPTADMLKYEQKLHGTYILYLFNSYVIAEQSEEILLKSDNPFALFVLAALYAYKAGDDEMNLFKFMRKLFELAVQKNIPKEELLQILTFVSDLMKVSEVFEKDLFEKNKSFYEEKTEEVMLTMEQKMVRTEKYLQLFANKSFNRLFDSVEVLGDEKISLKEKVAFLEAKETDIEAKAAAIETKAAAIEAKESDIEAKAAVIEAEKAKLEHERKIIILNLYQQLNLSVELIAQTTAMPLVYIQKVIDDYLTEKSNVIEPQ